MQRATLPELLATRARQTPNANAHWSLDIHGQWSPTNISQFYLQAVDLAWQLKTLGIEKGQTVIVLAASSSQWELAHHAILMLGGIIVGIDPEETSEHLETISTLVKIDAMIIDRVGRLEKFGDSVFNQISTVISLEDASESGKSKLHSVTIHDHLDEKLDHTVLSTAIFPNDIATIIFTSGTTGTPKGIAYRHEQIVTAIQAILDTFPEIGQAPCHLVCWLPLSNLFQRIVNLCALAGGSEIFFVTQPQKIIEYLPQINPHVFIAVPRFYEKLYQEVENKLNRQPKPIYHLLCYCLSAGENDSPVGCLFRFINRHLFKSFTSLFGCNIRYLISGSAPIPIWLLKRFYATGLLILESYGLSENVVPIAANRGNDYRFGTVGKPLSPNRVILAEDGELLVKGSGVFGGYVAEQQEDRRLTTDGYLASGDYAEIDEHGYIRLTGRKSDVFKTSTGRKIAPVEIEDLLKSHSKIEHAVVFGANRKFLTTLVTVGAERPEDANEMLDFARKLAKTLAETAAELPNYKRPVGAVLSFSSLSVERNELTRNLKLLRRNIQRDYGTWINQLYDALDNGDSTIHQQPLLIEPNIVLLKLPA
ncbi:AMP-dependent synthetase/ligase [Methylomonas sp. MED-D]|uniref:AMP-dependent synthetase/ligase n=1 Tax=Methylomonas sp. MED-D TaxID=3418768 RepID=UPI003CFE076A